MAFRVWALAGRSAARRAGQFAGADRIGVAALGDLLGHGGGLHQDLFQRLDLFDGQGAGFHLQAFDAVRVVSGARIRS